MNLEDIVAALEELVRQGKFQPGGNVNPADVLAALKDLIDPDGELNLEPLIKQIDAAENRSIILAEECKDLRAAIQRIHEYAEREDEIMKVRGYIRSFANVHRSPTRLGNT